MGKIVWLASYPESGANWLSMFLANLIAGSQEPCSEQNRDMIVPAENSTKLSSLFLASPKRNPGAGTCRDEANHTSRNSQKSQWLPFSSHPLCRSPPFWGANDYARSNLGGYLHCPQSTGHSRFIWCRKGAPNRPDDCAYGPIGTASRENIKADL